MANIARVRVGLTGFPGAPGVCTYFALVGEDLVDPLVGLWDSLADYLPPDVVVQVETSGDIINDGNGELVGSWTRDSVASFPGRAVAYYAAPVGACITWLTSAIMDSHHLKGRSFIVPLTRDAYADDGSLETTGRAAMVGAAAAFVIAAEANFVIWHRPRDARPASGTKPALTEHVGSHAFVTGSRVEDRAAVLRSRRD